MFESIRTLTDIPPGDGPRFAREDLAAARHRRQLLDEARRRAGELIAQANAEAEIIRSHAFHEGYSHAFIQASADMAELLVKARTLGAQLNRDLAQAAKQLLNGVLQDDQWLDQALQNWLAGQGSDQHCSLQVLLPERCRGQGKSLAGRIRERWSGPLAIEYHDQNRYLMRLADQVLEFDIDAIRSDLTPQLLARVQALPEAVRQLDEGVLQYLRQLLASCVEQNMQSLNKSDAGESDVD